ncbi:urease accessory protein [Hoeflea marina]|uniref:Urease accessory protein UreF n=1 Tax=Hoeflea marina TaxID=274592 RepID=A0A317PQ85_9HYPH|nr:urease accessory protein UreF [Hoeflea marina]PWW01750.1 urease accessory protein [Hoeflea marina]
MTRTLDLIRLMTWLSPTFPVGGFNYSHGLEQAVADARVADAGALRDWIETLLGHGSAWNDAVLLAESWRLAGEGGDLTPVCDLAEALAGSAERHLETMNQGEAFLAASRAWPLPVHEQLAGGCAWPVAVGAVAGASAMPLEQTLAAFLHAFSANQVQAALRLMRLGQVSGVQVLASLEAPIATTAGRAAQSSLDDLGGAALNADIAAMRHETLNSRIFRT